MAEVLEKSLAWEVPIATSAHGISVLESSRFNDHAILRVNTELLPVLYHATQKSNVGDKASWFRSNCVEKFEGRIKRIFFGLYTNIWFNDFIQVNERAAVPRTVVIDRMSAEFIQVDSNMLHGSSGSPVLNERGEVVGLVVIGDYIKNDWRGISIRDLYLFSGTGRPILKEEYAAITGNSILFGQRK